MTRQYHRLFRPTFNLFIYTVPPIMLTAGLGNPTCLIFIARLALASLENLSFPRTTCRVDGALKCDIL